MRYRALCFFAALTAFLCSLSAFCLDLEKEYKREIALYRIRPDQARSLKRDANGTPVSEAQLEDAVRSFYERLYLLDPGFLKRFKVKEVIFKDTVFDFDGRRFQDRLVEDDLFLDADLDDKQFYANMFLLQLPVMPRPYLNRWNKLNPDGFSYENSRGTLSDPAQKKLDAVLAEWDKSFVSRTGLYSTEMDMALTFTYMITRGPDATAFVKKNSPVVQKKFELLIDILENVKASEPGFLQTLLAEDLSKLKTYSPRALSARLYQEFTGEWNVPKLAEETDDDPEIIEKKAKERFNAPVEVAGRKVIPLILALEVNDFRLFSLLMENKADPNVVNGKKASALMLAISNNDFDEVKLLLEAGAKVTPDAARAGTASGVNAEIVKLLKLYLPGVKKTEPPEKKQTAKAAGTAKTRESAGGEVYQCLREVQIDHIAFDALNVAMAMNLLQLKLKDADPRGKGIQIAVPQTRKTANAYVTLKVDNLSVYEILGLICKETGLKMRIVESRKTVYLEEAESEKKNGTARGKQ